MSAVLDLDAIPAVTPEVPAGPWGVLADLSNSDHSPAGVRQYKATCLVAQLLGTTQFVAEQMLQHPDADARRLGVYLANKLELAQRGVTP